LISGTLSRVSSAPEADPFPPPCPQCGKREAHAIGVAIEDKTRMIVTLRCRACEHSWTIERPVSR